MFLSNFLIIGQQVMVLFILIAVGFICGKKGVINEKASKVMTDIVLYIVTPCVMVSAFQREFSTDTLIKVLIAALTALVILIASILLARLVFRTKEVARRKVLQFAVIFSNCGFMSLPLQKELLGEDGWFFGSIFVAVFNIVVWTYGLFDMSGDKKQLSVKRLALNPGIIGAVAAILLFVFSVQLPPIILQPVTHLANLNTPVPMLIIGFYLSQADFKKAFSDKGAYLAGAFRLIVIPLAAAFAMVLLKLDRTMIIAFAIACSAPTAATTTMFSAKFDRDVDLSVSVVASTTILSLLTMPLIVSLVWSIC
ncbi:AEC family transporter [Ruminococcus sp.]|uniref:AEC family transporter n=1 Tax=Ruminococcus sp. TaxID=41978 RepID=UPI002E77E5CB|nr:AEC family transporter [Ruminococcus sp.]MEE1262444.1 AEC family transporter [Ruminococcus sp.]